jgi:hypothetical protein
LFTFSPAIDFFNKFDATADLLPLESALNEGDPSKVYDFISDSLTASNLAVAPLIFTIAQGQIAHSESNRPLYPSPVFLAPRVRELVALALNIIIQTEEFPLDLFSDLCGIAFRFCPGLECLPWATALIAKDINTCEQSALSSRNAVALGEILHQSQDFGRILRFHSALGDESLLCILAFMRDQSYIGDLLAIGQFGEAKPAVESLLSFDGLMQCFHYITPDDGDLHRAAEMLMTVINNEIYPLDQAATLLSLAKMCCLAAGIVGELPDRIQNRLHILEIQKIAEKGGEQVLGSSELIQVFLEEKTVAVALCVYACSLEDRDDAENARVFVDILGELVGVVSDYRAFREILVEARAAVRLPAGWDAVVEAKFGDPATRASVTRAVLEAFDALYSE